MTVEKQDGSFEPFKIEKVDKVISSAAKTAKVDITNYWFKNINDYVLSNCEKEAVDDKIKSEVIRTHIENALMLYNFFDVEKVFRDECNRRETIRLTKFKVFKEMQRILSQKYNKERQNANLDANSFCGKIGEADGAFLKNYALDYMMTPELARIHRYWFLYIHDLDRYAVGMHNCISYPIDITIKGATIKVPKALRDAGSVSTFCQLAMVHLQSQSMCQFGGVSLTHLDWSLVPYVRKSFWRYYREALKYQEKFTGIHEECQIQRFERTECSIDNPRYSNIKCKEIAWENTVREINQSMESLLHNANTLQSRSGNQLPFTSINYGTCTKIEGQLVIEGILNAWEEGIGELHLTPIFPCGIFQLKDGINTKEGEPNYKYFRRALEILPKRDYPNFANADWEVDMAGFNKSQNIKRKTLQSLDEETLWKIKSLPENVQKTLGFWINDELKLEMNVCPQPFEMMSTMGCRTYNGFDINFTQDYFKHVLEETLKNYEQQQEELADIYKKLEVIEKLPVKNVQIYKEREALEELHDKVYNRIILPTRLLWSGNQKDGRGNIAPTTVMLPFIAMEAVKQAKKVKQSEYVVDFFMKQLEEMIGMAKDELIERYNWICAQSPDSAKYMYVENVTMLGGDDPVKNGLEPTMKHGTLAIGQIGLAETLEILIGCDQTTDKGMELAEKIEQLFNRKCAEYKEHYKLNFGVYYTPAENLCFTSMKAFKKKYGKNIKNVTYYIDEKDERQDKKFFTNSIHVPVYKNYSIFKKFSTEAKLAKYSNAGCITYGEIDDETKHNIDALEEIILYGKRLNLPYIALNFQINECIKCGGTDVDTEGLFCRICGAAEKFINWLRRITGYLNGNYKISFNEGKQDEVEKRGPNTLNIKWKNKPQLN